MTGAPAEMIEAALDDAANRSTTARADIKVTSAEAVTWPDGSLGCPQPGMMYTQALVAGYRIVLHAGDQVLSYHSAARGKPVFCPASRVTPPVPAQDFTRRTYSATSAGKATSGNSSSRPISLLYSPLGWDSP